MADLKKGQQRVALLFLLPTSPFSPLGLGKGFWQTRDYTLVTTGLLVSRCRTPSRRGPHKLRRPAARAPILPLAKNAFRCNRSDREGCAQPHALPHARTPPTTEQSGLPPLHYPWISQSWGSRALCDAALLPLESRVLSRPEDRGRREGEPRPGAGRYPPSAAGCRAPCSAPRLPCPAPGRESALLQLLRLLLLLQHLLRLLRLRLRLLPRRRLRRPPGLPGCCGRRGPARRSRALWPRAAARSPAPPGT